MSKHNDDIDFDSFSTSAVPSRVQINKSLAARTNLLNKVRQGPPGPVRPAPPPPTKPQTPDVKKHTNGTAPPPPNPDSDDDDDDDAKTVAAADDDDEKTVAVADDEKIATVEVPTPEPEEKDTPMVVQPEETKSELKEEKTAKRTLPRFKAKRHSRKPKQPAVSMRAMTNLARRGGCMTMKKASTKLLGVILVDCIKHLVSKIVTITQHCGRVRMTMRDVNHAASLFGRGVYHCTPVVANKQKQNKRQLAHAPAPLPQPKDH